MKRCYRRRGPQDALIKDVFFFFFFATSRFCKKIKNRERSSTGYISAHPVASRRRRDEPLVRTRGAVPHGGGTTRKNRQPLLIEADRPLPDRYPREGGRAGGGRRPF